jgi:hypothetical protein
MKLGVSYNVFDGEELLEGSIKQIRNQVDYVSVVYQTKSNLGNSCDKNLVPLLKRLQKNGLIDYIEEYKPIGINPHFDEITKRNIGLELSKKENCTHHMSMDTDEYYLLEDFISVKKLIEENDYDSSYCQMRTYYKTWDYQLDPPEDYYVSLIYKIKQNSKFIFAHNCPVLVDPTRRMSLCESPIILQREQIEMHHGSYIRNNIRTKLTNSSASVNFSKEIDKLVNHYDNWEYPQEVLWGGLPSKYLKVKEVKNKFLLIKQYGKKI